MVARQHHINVPIMSVFLKQLNPMNEVVLFNYVNRILGNSEKIKCRLCSEADRCVFRLTGLINMRSKPF